jgi:antagonist of KipI
VCTVLSPGLLSTVQDQGRTGYRAFGMPVSGAMDRYACTMANILAGNQRDAATVEMTMRGGRFQFSRPACVAVCGAEMQGELNAQKIRNWSSFSVARGDVLAFGYAVRGCRSYLAFRGGIAVPKILGSRSTCLRAQLGGYAGRALEAGDRLAISASGTLPLHPAELSSALVPEYANDVRLRVMLGPQDDLFTAEGIRTFLQGEYTVSVRNDRMGYRLEGPVIEHKHGADIISDALCFGAIQVPGSGMPIILGADCQTTGGYAKIATVIGADLPKVAQMKSGDKVRFLACSDEEAVAALRAERQCYEEACRVIDIDRSQL